MSLATRCTSCGTAFRVVQDQLKVSEGWVRCGRCNAVFNALEGLFDLGRDAPADWQEEHPDPVVASLAPPPAEWSSLPSPRTDAAEHADDADQARRDGDPHGGDLGELLADPVDAHLFGPRKRSEAKPKPAGQLGARDRVEFSDARFDSDLFGTTTPRFPTRSWRRWPVTDSGALTLESAVRPDFVRRADRHARWHSSSVRTVLGVACVWPRSFSRRRRRTTIATSSRRAGRRSFLSSLPGAALPVPDRGTAPDRRGPGREHRADARRRAGRVRPLGDAAQSERADAGAALDRSHPHRRQRPPGRAPALAPRTSEPPT
jgi:predicted Zn finger-like uncharacterized protein